MNIKMKKRYYTVLISFAILLITSIIAIGVLVNKLYKNEAKNEVYKIGNYELRTLPKECNKDLKIDAMNFTKNSAMEQKNYVYLTTDGETLILNYLDYLNQEDFKDDNAEDATSYTLTFENLDTLTVSLSFDDTTLTLILTYTYHV